MGAIRGAVIAENTAEDISQKSVELVAEIMRVNKLSATDIDAVIFSATSDLNACYPAAAVRVKLGLDGVSFMCLEEMKVVDSMPHCLRVCVLTCKLEQKDCRHCYIGQAKALRPDL